MNTEQFLDILQQRKLVSESVLDGIRTKLQKGDHRITAKSVLKYLVKKEILSRPQAKHLLNTTLAVTSSAESSILGMEWVPPQPTDSSQRKGPISADEIPTLSPVDSIDSENAIEDIREPSVDMSTWSEGIGSFSSESPPTPPDPSPPKSFTIADVTEAPKEQQKSAKKKKKRKKKSEWDSPLLLVGGAGLILLLLAGVIVSYLLNRENADTILADAEEFFDGGSYTQAIKQYERFVEKFPRHPHHSAAKVQLGMARLWRATQGSSQFTKAFNIAQKVLNDLKNEPAFRDAQDDLAALLPDIAQGLAKQAENASSPDEIIRLVEQTETALSLCANTKYIPEQYRDEVVLGEIEQTLEQVRRSQQQNVKLREALVNIQQAIDNRDTAEAYQIHRATLHDAPGLLNNEELTNKLREISASEQLVVEYIPEPKTAETSPRPSKIVATLALADRSGKPITRASGTVAVRIDGAVYGLKVADGTLLWHKRVGIAPTSPPVSLANGDLLIVSTIHNELLRLNLETGKLVWRHPFDTPIARPTVSEQRIFVAENTGKLHILELASGNRSGYVQFDQPIPLPVTVSKNGNRIYVVGEHSSLFTLSADDFACLGVHYLGHNKGSISVPLLTVLNKVIAAVNTGIETSVVHVLNLDDNGVLAEAAATQRFTGLINTKMLSAGRRLVVLTSLGQIMVSEISPERGKDALTPLASREADGYALLARFGLLHQGHIWSAGSQLNRLAILPTGNRLPVQNIDNSYQGDTFDHPLQVVENILIHVRRPANRAGAIVAAMDLKSGKAYWETQLATPPAGSPAVDLAGPKITTITSSAAAYQFDRESLRLRVQNQATRPPIGSQITSPLTLSVDLAQGRIAAGALGAKTLVLYLPRKTDRDLTIIKLPGPLSSTPIAWGENFVVPTSTGQVFLYGNADGKQVGTPFQPALAPGDSYNWLTPTIVGKAENSRLILSDGQEKLYAIAQATSPQPHLITEVEAAVGPARLITRLATIGNLVCAGTDSGKIARFQLPKLTPLDSVALQAKITWGPFRVGEQLLCSTDTNELICLNPQAEIAWRQPLAHGQPIGIPIVSDASLFIAWQAGSLSQIAQADGSEIGHTLLEHPATAGPVPLGKRFVITSSDGTLLVVDRP